MTTNHFASRCRPDFHTVSRYNSGTYKIRHNIPLSYDDVRAMPHATLQRLSFFGEHEEGSVLHFVNDYTAPFGYTLDLSTPVPSYVSVSNIAYITAVRGLPFLSSSDSSGHTQYYNPSHISCFSEQGHRLNLVYAPPPSNVPSAYYDDADLPFYRQLHIPNTVNTLELLRSYSVLRVPNALYHNLIETFERGLVLPNRPADYTALPQGIPAIG